MRRIVYLLIFCCIINACEGFLSKSPDSAFDIEIDSEDKVAELLASAYPNASYFSFLEGRTDNVGERIYGERYQLNEAMYFWEDYEQDDLDTPLFYWNSCYRGIAQANKALEVLSRFPKSDRVKALYAEAFLLRAYLHFMLVNIWAQPYRGEASKEILGIPYITKVEKNALPNYKRNNLYDVYELIEKDLKRGITLVTNDFYEHPKYHFNKKAAYAFASRFYLFKADWQRAKQYADYVLGADSKADLKPWYKYEQKYRFNREDLYKDYSATDNPANLLLSTTESRWARNLKTQAYATTDKQMDDIFNKQGIKACADFKNMNLEPCYVFNSSAYPVKDGAYIAKYSELSTYLSVGTKPKGLYNTNILFSVEEVLLNRIEANTMLKDYEAAVNDILNFLQAKYNIVPPCGVSSFTSSGNTALYNNLSPFYGLSIRQISLIQIVLDFRQKEFLQEGLRWFDIRRFNMSIQRNSNNPRYRSLEKDDPRKTLQIPAEAIRQGLEPNYRNNQLYIIR